MRDEATPSERLLRHQTDFSLVLGGPLFRLLSFWKLSDGALAMLNRRIAFFVLICWMPMFLLAALQGLLFKGSVPVPFLLDIGAHIRFLIVIPILLGAELIVHNRMRSVVQQFLERNLISDRDMPRFDAALASTSRLRNSVVAEILLILIVFSAGVLIWRSYASLDTTTWMTVSTASGNVSSYAGIWFRYVSLPIFQFLMFRWYFRVFVWARLLWMVSRLNLRLLALHPDRVGGIGFLTNTVRAFIPLIVAHGALFAGLVADHIFFLDAQLTDFKLEITVLTAMLLCLVLGPLLVFTPQLVQTKRIGRREYGTLAERYVRAFDAKWLRGGAPKDEDLMGSADIQSLADLGNSYSVVQDMRTTLISRDGLVLFTCALIAPLLPLILTMLPLKALVDKLLGILI